MAVTTTADDVWLIGATYYCEEALADLGRFVKTESYRERLRQLVRLCKGDVNPLSQFTVALGIAAQDDAAISFFQRLKHLCKYEFDSAYLVTGTLDHWWWNVKRQPNNPIAQRARQILATFPYAGKSSG